MNGNLGMATVLLDACVPVWLAKELVGVEVETARNAGFDALSDGELLDAIDGRFDVLVNEIGTSPSNKEFPIAR